MVLKLGKAASSNIYECIFSAVQNLERRLELLESKLGDARKDENGASEKVRRFSTRVSKVSSQMPTG